jgi:Ca-activated chloride channel family protein
MRSATSIGAPASHWHATNETLAMNGPRRLSIAAAAFAATVVTLGAQQTPPPRKDGDDAFRFRSAVELINVTATVTDASGRFVPNLRQEDFRVFDDGQEQPITHFSRERVPVSLGIAIDTSNSMEGEKMEAARDALTRFLLDLLDPDDEVFLYRFSTVPQLVEGWTTNRDRLQSRLRRLVPDGGTALYDAVADAVPLAERGRNRKKALLIISDGNDTNSETTIAEVKRQIRVSEVMVYAIGIDAQARSTWGGGQGSPLPPRQPPTTFPFPFPRRPPAAPPRSPLPGGMGGSPDERVNVEALRDITDDSGGRTEIVRSPRDLDPATESIANELSRQYSLGYPSSGKKDGRWHSIVVEVRAAGYHVRARRGYVATP